VGSIAILDVVVQNGVLEELEFHSQSKNVPLQNIIGVCKVRSVKYPLLEVRRGDIFWKLIHADLERSNVNSNDQNVIVTGS
jgi:hypothetical protein